MAKRRIVAASKEEVGEAAAMLGRAGGLSKAAAILGHLGGLKGGKARKEAMTGDERRKCASGAAKARWHKKRS